MHNGDVTQYDAFHVLIDIEKVRQGHSSQKSYESYTICILSIINLKYVQYLGDKILSG